jgi:mono/diheme cytochrome c family protein
MILPQYFGRMAVLALVASASFSATSAKGEDTPKAVPPDHAARMAKGLALFKEQVRPALVEHCLECHGGKSKKGDFDLSDRKPLVESGTIEGDSKETRLYALITHAEEPYMPHKRPKLPEATIEAIARWIDLGAPYDRPLIDRKGGLAAKAGELTDPERNFWSFRPLRAVAPPLVRDSNWSRTPIDRFILAALEAKGLRPNTTTDRRSLIRRVTFALIGLPPTPEEVEAFLADESPDAYEKVVDRLLGSPHFGERWARHWLDVARFAESHGYEQDYDRPHAFHYRDFLIRAINDDLPYDEFVRRQVAGDELAPDDPMAAAATGFLGAGAFPTQLTEAEFESARYNELDDMAATTGSAFLGLSVGCARCHDHKFDPIPSEDYYRLAATFTTTIRSEIDLPLGPGRKSTKVQVTSEGYPHTKHNADERGFPHFYPKTYVLARGDASQRKGEAEPGFLRVLVRDAKGADAWRVEPPSRWTRTSFRRAALATWLTDVDRGAGPLAARVAVNRLWQHHLGRGIVATPNDFGAQGERPTHPELLDWLAGDLVRHGWRLKRLHRMIVTSAVYMQDGRFDEARARVDRENALRWRYAPRRLEAEPIRDAMLAVAGRLDGAMYGPGTLDPEMRRRSVYFFIKRSQLIPAMMLFDWPEPLVSIGRRSTTTTAPQALMFMNSPLGRRCAEGFAGRLAGESPGAAVRRAYLLAYGREPTGGEARISAEFLAEQSSRYAKAGRADADRAALVDFCQGVMSASEFIYVP